MHQHEGAPDPRQTPPRTFRTLHTPFAPFTHLSHPSHTFRTPSDSTPAQHPLHNSHAIPRGANLGRPHKPHNSAIVDSTFERLTGKLHATLWGNHRRNVGGQGAAEPRTRRHSFARRPRRPLLPVGAASRAGPDSPYCPSDSSAHGPAAPRDRPLLPVGQLRTRPSSSARPAPTAGRTAPHTAQQLRATSPYCRSDSSRFARTTMPMRVIIC